MAPYTMAIVCITRVKGGPGVQPSKGWIPLGMEKNQNFQSIEGG